ncbi:hypothetical protein ACTPOK_00585 [Streptomyces inhibens]|uniref:hypothetical protein n=1 Tax=Streptomyces inhibens TaxID=2293571 RepID=UPI00402AE5A3
MRARSWSPLPAALRAALGRIRSIRRPTNPGPDPQTHPAEWERRRPLRALRLLLEAVASQG